MINSINEYLECLDKILDNIPRKEKVLRNKLINISYGLINSSNILVDIQYMDYLICYMLKQKYINYNKFLLLGMKLENIIYECKNVSAPSPTTRSTGIRTTACQQQLEQFKRSPPIPKVIRLYN